MSVVSENFNRLNTHDIYNLYNEETTIIDFSSAKQINLSIKVTINNYVDILLDFSPDNLNHIVIIGLEALNIPEIVVNIDNRYKFKNYYFFNEKHMLSLYEEFPIIFNGVKKTYPSLITQLLPKRVFLGSVKTVTTEFLQINKIDKIINMCYSALNVRTEENFPIEDDESVDISKILDKTYTIIDNSQNVLVVCEKGRSRSVSMVLHYYIKKYNLSLMEGLNGLKKCRSVCKPNDGFLMQINAKIDSSA